MAKFLSQPDPVNKANFYRFKDLGKESEHFIEMTKKTIRIAKSYILPISNRAYKDI